MLAADAATVNIIEDAAPCSRGVLVPGGCIITAAHCVCPAHGIEWESGDPHPLPTIDPVSIESSEGERWQAAVEFIELVSDIALLWPPPIDSDDRDAFDSFRRRVEPLTLGDPAGPLFVRNAAGEWQEATLHSQDAIFPWFKFQTAGEGPGRGASGGPVIDAAGRLAGVMISSTDDSDASDAIISTAVRPKLALPVWILRRIAERMQE